MLHQYLRENYNATFAPHHENAPNKALVLLFHVSEKFSGEGLHNLAGQCFKTGSLAAILTVTSAELVRPGVSGSPNKSSEFGGYYIQVTSNRKQCDNAIEAEQNAYIGKLGITGKLFEHALNAVIFTISLSSSLKDGAEDILWRFMLFNALSSLTEIKLPKEYKR
jgi:hypothetical protein